MPTAGGIGLCGKVCMGLYGETSKKSAITSKFTVDLGKTAAHHTISK
jgi:hypothetical protein